MAIQTRDQLKAKFITGAKPQEQDYHDLIDSVLQVTDDLSSSTSASLATEWEAKQGVDDTKLMTAFRTAQAIEAKIKDLTAWKRGMEEINNDGTVNTLAEVFGFFEGQRDDDRGARALFADKKGTAFNRNFGIEKGEVAEGSATMAARSYIQQHADLNAVITTGVYELRHLLKHYHNAPKEASTGRMMIVFAGSDGAVIQWLFYDGGFSLRRRTYAGWTEWAPYGNSLRVESIQAPRNLDGYVKSGVYEVLSPSLFIKGRQPQALFVIASSNPDYPKAVQLVLFTDGMGLRVKRGDQAWDEFTLIGAAPAAPVAGVPAVVEPVYKTLLVGRATTGSSSPVVGVDYSILAEKTYHTFEFVGRGERRAGRCELIVTPQGGAFFASVERQSPGLNVWRIRFTHYLSEQKEIHYTTVHGAFDQGVPEDQKINYTETRIVSLSPWDTNVQAAYVFQVVQVP